MFAQTALALAKKNKVLYSCVAYAWSKRASLHLGKKEQGRERVTQDKDSFTGLKQDIKAQTVLGRCAKYLRMKGAVDLYTWTCDTQPWI